jgi:cell division septum initiation protein DivIVA
MIQNFRKSIGGFNREDVVQYIQYINAKYSAEVKQLQSEIQNLKDEIAAYQGKLVQSVEDPAAGEAKARIAALEQENQSLREALEQAQNQPETQPVVAPVVSEAAELEAYRRAERTERLASERAAQVYQMANGVLADATVQVDEASSQLSSVTDLAISRIKDLTLQLSDQMHQLQAAVQGSKESLQKAADTMAAIRPASEE